MTLSAELKGKETTESHTGFVDVEYLTNTGTGQGPYGPGPESTC